MGLLRAELLKLTSVRTTWIVTLIGWALVALGSGFFLFESEFTGEFTGADGEIAAAVDQVGGLSVVVLVVGLLAVTTEFRHQTIGRTLQLTPGRSRMMLAKLVVGALYGALFFLGGVVVVAVLVAIAGMGEQLVVDAATLEALWQGPAGLALTAVFGVAIGALLRNQVVAITASLVYVMLGETLVNQFAPEVARWLPFQVLNSLFLSDEVMGAVPEGSISPLDPAVALPLFVGYVAVTTVAAIVLMRVRDV